MRHAIQLLIVAWIGLSCGGILTIFIVKVREAADRAQCNNNLKQLGLAIANYHDTCRNFPPAAESNPDLPPEKRISWMVAIIPFLEANNIYNRIDHKKGWDAEGNRFAALTLVRTWQCPAYPRRPPDSTFVPSHYLGISGIGDNAIALPREDPRAGIFGYDRPAKLEELKRGFDEMLLSVETSQAHGAWTAAGSPTTRGLIPDGAPYIGVGRQFGGNHPHGANAVFADGSVRFIEQAIDPAVWEAMATLSGKGNRE